jgi:uncharacterized glyoxalase superfamily protein PhnB
MPDRLEALKLPSTPLAPSARFSRQLYERLREELAPLLPLTLHAGTERQDAMTASTTSTVAPPIAMGLPSLDAHAEIKWLTEVLGFRLTALFDEPDGGVAHSQLAWKGGAVHVSTRKGPWPEGRGASSMMLFCEDRAEVDRLYERAVAAGAEITRAPEETFYGGYGFSVRDPEGNLWNPGIAFLDTDAAKGLPQRRI